MRPRTRRSARRSKRATALDGLVYNIDKMLKETGEKVQAADKTEVESALADAKKTLEGTPSAAECKQRTRS